MRISPPIELVHVGDAAISPRILATLTQRLATTFGCEVMIGEPLPLADLVADPVEQAPADIADRRLCSNRVIDTLVDRPARRLDDDDSWTLGVTAHDLYAPDRSFVFGEATLGGRWAIVSAARFGVPETGSPRLLDRLLKESLHELGHLRSLAHCEDIGCPMSFSRRVADIDRKKTDFCDDCARRIFTGNYP